MKDKLILDLETDAHAIPALRAYAESVRRGGDRTKADELARLAREAEVAFEQRRVREIRLSIAEKLAGMGVTEGMVAEAQEKRAKGDRSVAPGRRRDMSQAEKLVHEMLDAS
jgi:hypothetical protein